MGWPRLFVLMVFWYFTKENHLDAKFFSNRISTLSQSSTVRATYVKTSEYYNCILHRKCSVLKFFLCVWLAFVLMLTIFHLKAKTFSWQESSPNKTFFPWDDENCQHQHKGTHTRTQEKSQVAATSLEDGRNYR
jgi:hypothetical protein